MTFHYFFKKLDLVYVFKSQKFEEGNATLSFL